MDVSLDGIELKLDRALVQFNALKSTIDILKTDKPYEFIPYANPQTGEIGSLIHIHKPVDPMWGILIGEYVHNLRSALDHIVWQLVILNTGAPPTTKTQFPIFKTEAGWNYQGRGEKFTHGASVGAKALVKTLQPFSTGEGNTSPLWHLHEISNWDKHRTIAATHAVSHSISVKGIAGEIDALFVAGNGPIQNDAKIWAAWLTSTDVPFMDRFDKVNVEGQITVQIAFKDPPAVAGQPVVQILAAIGSRVVRTINRLHEEIFQKPQ